MAVAVFGVIRYQIKHGHRNVAYTSLAIAYFVLLISTGNFSYYFLPLCVFVPMGVGLGLDWLITKLPKLKKAYLSFVLSALLLIASLFMGNGTIELDDKKSDYIHFQIAQDIRAINNENPTLFCYKLWDYGFYNVLGITPNVKYYANSLFSEKTFPEIYEAFSNYISTQQTEFLLMDKSVYEKEQSFISSYYEPIKTYSYHYYKDNYRSFQMTVVLLIAK